MTVRRSHSRTEGNTAESGVPNGGTLGWPPFHTAAKDYYEAGYFPIPLPEGKKFPPPDGTPNDLEYNDKLLDDWLGGVYHSLKGKPDRQDWRHKNIGCIVPDGTVVFDVDGTAAKETLREMESQLGPLPRTWMSTRGEVDRYHLWFSIPDGLTWPGRLAPGIDVIYRHYRYM